MKKKWTFVFFCLILIVVVGVSYAYWKVDLFQTDANIANSSCFQLSFEEQNEEIQLQEVMPITDSEGKRLQPYTFTVTNTCSNLASYQINLENILHEYKELPLEYVKVELDNNTPVILTNHKEVEKSLEESKEAYKLTSGTLEGKESVTYELRIWIDEDTPASDETSEASFLSKVSVITSPTTEEDITNDIQIAIESTTLDYNKEKEDFSINAISSKGNLISYLYSDKALSKEELKQEMNWSLILPEDKTFTTTKSFTEEGTNYLYIKDEYGNIEESEIVVTKIDREGPRVIEISKSEDYSSSNTIIARVIDEKSGFIGYALVLGSNEPNEYETVENTKNEYTITKEVNENGTYTLWLKDNLGNISKEEIEISNIDTIAPVVSEITNSSNGNWVNTSINLSWDITENESGIGRVQISIDGTNFTDLSESEWNGKTFDNERNDTIYIRAIDKAGNISNVVSTNMKIDKSAPSKPVLESTFTDGSGSYTSGNWTNKSVNIKSTSSDTLSGGVKTYYSYNQIEWYEDWNGTNSAVVIGTWTGEYDKTIYFKAVDAVGNTSEYSTIDLKIDKTKPSNSFSIHSKTDGSDGWYRALTLKATVNDSGGSGLDTGRAYYCKTTGNDCTPDTKVNLTDNSYYTYTVPGDGSYWKICSRVSDKAGNVSDKQCSSAYKVDNTNSSSSFSIASSTIGNKDGNTQWYKALSLKVSIEENHSGINTTKYCTTTNSSCTPNTTANVSNKTYTVTLGSNASAQRVCSQVTDKAGNPGSVQCSSAYYVDTTDPSASISASVDNCNSGITVSGSGSDSHSGLSTIQYKLDNGQWYGTGTSTTYNFTNVTSGSHTVYVKAIDKAGREKTASTTVSVTSNLLINKIKCTSKVTSGIGLYEVGHSDASITYTTNTTYINNLKQTELRYAGKSPNNYVTFNNETWRIIGLVNTPEGQRVKIIRNDSIGRYSWDSSALSVNNGKGVNEWSQADLKTLLNSGAYYNRTSGTCYNGEYGQTTSCDFSSTGLTDNAKNMIDTVTWNLGVNPTVGNGSLTPKAWYNAERGNVTGKQCSRGTYCNDTVTRTLTWSGRVGLMYPSDYGYATSDRTCLTRSVNSTSTWNFNCSTNDWLYGISSSFWILTSSANSSTANLAFYLNHSIITSFNVIAANEVLPTVHLLSSVKVTSGNGSSSSPYTLSL